MKRKHSFRLAAAAAAIASLAIPATVSAHQPPSPQTVVKHARSADQALDRVASLVARNQDAAAAIALARNRRETRNASREAGRLAKRRGNPAVRRAALATRTVAKLHDHNAEVLADIVDEAGGALALDIARAVDSDLRGRESALSVLTRLMGRLPMEAREGIARALAALSADGDDEIASLVQALQSGNLPPEAAAAVQHALARAVAGIDTGIERLRSIIDEVPAEARPHLEMATGQLEQVQQMLQDLLGGGLPPIRGGLPIPCGLLPVPLPGC